MIVTTFQVCLLATLLWTDPTEVTVTLSAGDRADVEEVVAGDPLLITLTVANMGNVPVSVVRPEVGRRGSWGPGESTVRFEVAQTGDGYKMTRPISLIPRGDGPVGGQWQIATVQPGDSIHFVLLPSWWYWEGQRFNREAQWAFPAPGEYCIKATISILDRAQVDQRIVPRAGTETLKVTSDPLVVRVVHPESEADQKAAMELVASKEAWRIYEPWYNRGLPEALIAFRERHPESRFVSYMEMADLYVQFLRAQQAQDQRAMRELWKECEALVAEAKQVPWPSGWIATAEELHLRMRHGAPEGAAGPR